MDGVPAFPMTRRCPVRPAGRAGRAAAGFPRAAVERQHPVAGPALRRRARAAARLADQRRLGPARLSAPERRFGGAAEAREVVHHHGRRRARGAAPAAHRRLPGQEDGGAAPGHPAHRGRPDRRPARRPEAGRPGDGVRAAGAVAGDLRTARRALRGPGVLPGHHARSWCRGPPPPRKPSRPPKTCSATSPAWWSGRRRPRATTS